MLVSDSVFKKVYEAFERHDSCVTIVPTKSMDALSTICAVAAANATCAIYINSFEFQRVLNVTRCIPQYAYGLPQLQQYIAECRKKRAEIIDRCKASNTYDTVLAIHDELTKGVRYQENGKLSHSIVGPLLFGRGVCDGFSKTLKYILDELSIPCFVVSGTATDPQTGINESHAWNIVKIDNSWVHIDLTFDATISQPPILRHDYFGLNTPTIARDHQFNLALYPVSSTISLEYHHKKNLIVSDKRKIPALVLEKLNKGETHILFRLEKQDRCVDHSNEILQQTSSFLLKHGINAMIAIHYNLAQSVYCITVNEDSRSRHQLSRKVKRFYLTGE